MENLDIICSSKRLLRKEEKMSRELLAEKADLNTNITLAIDCFPLSKLKLLEELILDLQKLR